MEVCVGRIWGTVTDDGWDNRDAVVVCRQLGFNASVGERGREVGVVGNECVCSSFFVRSTVAKYNVKIECGFHYSVTIHVVATYVSTIIITRSAHKCVKIILHFLQCGVNFETLPVLMYCVSQQEKQFNHF